MKSDDTDLLNNCPTDNNKIQIQMIRYTFRSFGNILVNQSRSIFQKIASPGYTRHSFIIIPEIPNKSIDKNLDTILSDSTYDNFIEISKYINEFDSDLSSILDKIITTKSDDLTFDNSIVSIERAIRMIDLKVKYLRLKYSTRADPILEIIYGNLFRKSLVANQQVLSIPHFRHIFEQLSKSSLTDSQKNYLEYVQRNLVIYGFGLQDQKITYLHEIINKLLTCQMKFRNSVHISMRNVKQLVHVRDMRPDTPAWLLNFLRVPHDKDILTISLDDPIIKMTFFRYCSNHQIRNQIWLADKQLGGKILFKTNQSNYHNIKDIREHRKDIARIFQEKSYCDVILNSNKRMAKSLDEVLNVLQLSKESIMPNAEYEYNEVLEYARKEKHLKDSLMLCDYDYLHDCFATDVVKCPWRKLEIENTSFEIDKLLNRILYIIGKLFDISFSKLSSSGDKIIYSVSETKRNEAIGEINFIIQKYSSNCSIQIIPIHDEDKLPVSFVLINLYSENPNIFNTWEIIGNIGFALEGLYNNTQFEVTPLFCGLPPDAFTIVSKFLLQTFFSSKHIMEYIFPELDPKLAEELSNSYTSRSQIISSNVKSIEHLSKAYFDLEIWLSDKDWRDIQVDVWNIFFSSQSKLNFPYEKMDEWACGAVEIFAQNIWGGVTLYSWFWENHVVKAIQTQFIKEKIVEWDPNEELNPDLKKTFTKFKRLFIEDQLTCRRISLSQFLK